MDARERTLKETDKKCANCGGTLQYDPDKYVLVCPFCDSEFDFEEEKPEIAKEIDVDDAIFTANCEWGKTTRSVLCKSCGAESLFDGRQVADVCPYCGSNLVVEAGGTDCLAPNGICPFEISTQEATDAFKTWIKNKIFTPRAAKRAVSPESFKGVYLPYWTFDADTFSSYTGEYGIDYTETDDEGHSHTETDWYRTSGTYSRFFNDLLVSGTNRYDGCLMARIEPFDTDGSVTYKPEYLAGYYAEKYTVGLHDAWEEGQEICEDVLHREVERKIKRDHHADDTRSVRVNTKYTDLKYKYLMLPVWLSSFTYKDKIYRFMVNGQTGKVGGKAPVSFWRVLFAVLLGLGLIVLCALLLLYCIKE